MTLLGMLARAALMLASSASGAQSPLPQADHETPYAASFTFDVASVRESPPSDSYSVRVENPTHNSLLDVTNFDAESLVGMAYSVGRAQIVGLPATRPALFNIRAKSDASTDDRLARLDDKAAWLEKQHMLQMLLADRFRLRVHWETKEAKMYSLFVARNGLKMKLAGTIPPTAAEKKTFNGGAIPPLYQRGDGGRGYEFVGHQCPIASLAAVLASQLGASVVDRTNLRGTFDFVLQYKSANDEDTQDDPTAWPALDIALPEQLGLKLQQGKGETKFLVIDHFERPSQN